MENLNVVIALTTRQNDYQAEQAQSAVEVASRLGIKIDIIYADGDAVNQSQQLVKIIQDRNQHPTAILVEPVGTPMPQVAKAAVAAGIGWGILNREADYITELRRTAKAPVFAVSPDQEEVGRFRGSNWPRSPARATFFMSKDLRAAAPQLSAPRECFPPSRAELN